MLLSCSLAVQDTLRYRDWPSVSAPPAGGPGRRFTPQPAILQSAKI